MSNKTNTEITIRSAAAEYLTYVAATGDALESFEMRYEGDNIWLTQQLLPSVSRWEMTVPYNSASGRGKSSRTTPFRAGSWTRSAILSPLPDPPPTLLAVRFPRTQYE